MDGANSIFNDVLGPVMRGPSSSHTAGSHRIGFLLRHLLGGEPVSARGCFDPDGSYAQVYREQGSDAAIAAGLLGWPITDPRFDRALESAVEGGLYLEFSCEKLEGADHPNTVEFEIRAGDGTPLRARAKSVGGGRVVVDRLDDWEVRIVGNEHELLLEMDLGAEAGVVGILAKSGIELTLVARLTDGDRMLVHHRSHRAPPEGWTELLKSVAGVRRVWSAPPLYLLRTGNPLFRSAAEMVAISTREERSLGRSALAYEAQLLGMSEDEAAAEMRRRYDFMHDAVVRGGDDGEVRMQLLAPSAGGILRAEAAGELALGGPLTRAAARALAAMHTTASGGVVCAAPTGGAAGTLPGVMTTLAEERNLDDQGIVEALFAAGAIGIVIAERATFAAEEAGCQVEIGAAGAMAAAAVIEAAGGTAAQATDAAAIALQNTMGSVCDLVQGIVELPCHTRNAVAASSAFICADLILGGYANPVPLDETIDAMLSVGRMLPPELRCTARGGLAVTPSAQDLPRRR
jgi:L-serine dehydratase